MEFIDLAAQQRRIRKKIHRNIRHVLEHGQYIMGPEIKELEATLAGFVGVRHALSCSSGTDALLLGLMAEHVGPGDAIFTSPFTFIATAEVISLLGATPIFVDIDRRTYNIDPEHLQAAIGAVRDADSTDYPMPGAGSSRSLKPKGIIAVDLFGLPADYDRINAIGRDCGVFVIEDAAQSFGSEFRERKSCSLAPVACTSFFPAKPLGCYGDGGMCFTDNGELAETMGSLRIHGKGGHKYDNVRIGINGRMDTLQAAVLLAKFEIFVEELMLRQQVADRYNRLLAGVETIELPQVPDGCRSAWAQYSILAESENHRSRLQALLKDQGIPTVIYYPKPLHLQTAFASLGYRLGDFPVSENCSKRIFSLPMHPYLTEVDQQKIAEVIWEAKKEYSLTQRTESQSCSRVELNG
jgi:UDP-2-acetamido-2-deoxy-ribo-hexuluronate aminotransferase